MDDLRAEYEALTAQIRALEKRRQRVIKKLFKPPSERDARIAIAYLNDRKIADIARNFNLSKSRISRIVKNCIPFVAGKLREYGR